MDGKIGQKYSEIPFNHFKQFKEKSYGNQVKNMENSITFKCFFIETFFN